MGSAIWTRTSVVSSGAAIAAGTSFAGLAWRAIVDGDPLQVPKM
jgi:hypothetical protein